MVHGPSIDDVSIPQQGRSRIESDETKGRNTQKVGWMKHEQKEEHVDLGYQLGIYCQGTWEMSVTSVRMRNVCHFGLEWEMSVTLVRMRNVCHFG